ncbi:MAG: hypothetical protein KDD56_09775, partial [Bdellovibrionales bacterium]|nr:hypothetical protein [Bdellovibrionales bacterium]
MIDVTKTKIASNETIISSPADFVLRSVPDKLLSNQEEKELTLQTYRLRRDVREMLLLLPVATELANVWVQKLYSAFKTKHKLHSYKNVEDKLFYSSGGRQKLKFSHLIPKLKIAAFQIFEGKILIDPEVSKDTTVNPQIFALQLECIEKNFTRYLQGEISLEHYNGLLKKAYLGLRVAHENYGTGSVFLSDFNFEEILDLALKWNKKLKQILNQVEKLSKELKCS